MIGKTYDFRKLEKLENDLNSFTDNIKIDERALENEHIQSPINAFSHLETDEFEEMYILEMLNHLKLDLNILDVINQTYFNIIHQSIILFKYKYDRYRKDAKEEIDQLIVEYNELTNNFSNKATKDFIKRNLKFASVYYKDYLNSDDFSLIKELEVLYIKKILDFKALVINGKYPYIDSVNYMLLKNMLVTYSLVNHKSSNLLDIVSVLLNQNEKYIDLVTDEKFLNEIESTPFEITNQEVKDRLAPNKLSNMSGINQNDLLTIQKKQISYIKEIPLDYAILDLESVFKFNTINKYGISKILYDLLQVSHNNHPDFPFYTFVEWQDEQDREGKIPTNKGWKTHMLRRIEKISPNIFK